MKTIAHAVVIATLFMVATAWAGRRDNEDAAKSLAGKGPVASAAEIPALANLLQKSGWQPTPELSGVFKAGSIFEKTSMGDRTLATGCFSVTPDENTYTATELVTSLQAGVSVGAGPASGGAYAGIVKKIKFGAPTHVTIPVMDLQLSKECAEKLQKLPATRIQSAYVVQEVLRAEISEQTCGKVDAKGQFIGLGSADTSYSAACAQTSLEPVAVGYRTLPLSDLLSVVGDSAIRSRRSSGSVTPAEATAAVSFGQVGSLGVEAKLREQRCDEEAKASGAASREARLSNAESSARSAATVAWKGMATELEACTLLKRADRTDCIVAAEEWLSRGRSINVSIPAGEESVESACGLRSPAYPAERRSIAAYEVKVAEDLLLRLRLPDAVMPTTTDQRKVRFAFNPFFTCTDSMRGRGFACQDRSVGMIVHIGTVLYTVAQEDMLTLLQAGIYTRTGGEFHGIAQFGLLSRVDGDFSGLGQIGLVALTGGEMTGAQFGPYLIGSIYNRSGSLRGLQFAIVNQSGRVSGVQIGLVNVSSDLHGIQIGLINRNKAGRTLPVLNIGR